MADGSTHCAHYTTHSSNEPVADITFVSKLGACACACLRLRLR